MKFEQKRGETLAETLVSLAIFAISAALLASMISAAADIGAGYIGSRPELYSELSSAESQSGEPLAGEIIISREGFPGREVTFDVNVYGGENFKSYSAAGDKEGN